MTCYHSCAGYSQNLKLIINVYCVGPSSTHDIRLVIRSYTIWTLREINKQGLKTNNDVFEHKDLIFHALFTEISQ